MRHVKWVSAVAVVVALAAGCGGESDTANPAASPPSTAPATAPAPAGPTVEEAGKAYLALVNPLNRDLKAINDRIEASAGDDGAFADAIDDYSAMCLEFRRGLVAIDFPSDLQPLVGDLARSAGQVASTGEALAAEARDPTFAASDRAAEFRSATADLGSNLTLMRAALDLPEPPKP